VLGQHILVAGATGSGKSSVLWSIIAALAPGVRAGWVRLLVVDPKGGMEFGRGQALFTGFAYDNGENTLGLLRAVTTVMAQRAQRLRGHTRLHTPTTAEPLIVLIVDEIASLTAYIGDRKIRDEVEKLLGLLLSQGRGKNIGNQMRLRLVVFPAFFAGASGIEVAKRHEFHSIGGVIGIQETFHEQLGPTVRILRPFPALFRDGDLLRIAVDGGCGGKHDTPHTRLNELADQRDSVPDVVLEILGWIDDRFPDFNQRREMNAGFQIMLASDSGHQFSIANLSRWAFLLTFAGVGLRTNFREMRKQGLRPFAVGFIGEIAIALFTLVLVIAAGRLFGF